MTLGEHRSSVLKIIFSRRMLVALVMGYACGLPLHLTLDLLKAWMAEAGVDLTVIGLMALVGLPYTLKFVWAPVMDRFTLPFLGRRRGWLLVAQFFLMLSIVWLGFSDPVKSPWLLAVAAFFVTFFSASQDIVVDAYRREDLADQELGLGSSLYVNGYRIGMLVAASGGLIMADHLSFSTVYIILALCLLPGVVATLLSPEPEAARGTPRTMKEAVYKPFAEFLGRNGALGILAFVLLYKIGDTMAAAMAMPFYLDTGFSKTQIGTLAKLFGFWATIIGGLAGGLIMLRVGIRRSLWGFGILQGVSTAGFAVLAAVGYSVPLLAGVIAFENLSSGMGTAAYAGYMASITNKRFTATQYALLTSLMGIPRVLASAPTGFLAKNIGWAPFFVMCALVAVPGLLLLLKIGTWDGDGSR